mgnify:CR=1 FL=1
MAVSLADALGLAFIAVTTGLTLLGALAIAIAGPKWGGKVAATMFRFALAMFLLLLAVLWVTKSLG